MNYRFLKNVVFDIFIVWASLIGGFYYGNAALENVAYFVVIFASIIGSVAGLILCGTKDESLKRVIKKKSPAHSAYCRISIGLEVLFMVAMGHVWLGAWYLIACILMISGCDKAIGDIEAMTND